MDEPDLGLPRTARLRRRAEFRRVETEGRAVRVGPLVVSVLTRPRGPRRLGLVVPGRVGNAVKRNLVKRWLREIFRAERAALPESVDVVVVARRGAVDAGLDGLRASFLEAAGRLSKAGA